MSDYSEFDKERKPDRLDPGAVSNALKDFDELLDYQKAGNAQGAFRAGDIEIHNLDDLEPGQTDPVPQGSAESSPHWRKADTSGSREDSGRTDDRIRNGETSSDAWRPAIMKNAMDRESARKLRAQTGTSATKATIQYTLMRDRRIAEQRLEDDSWSPKPIEEILAEAPAGTYLKEDPAAYDAFAAEETGNAPVQESDGAAGLKSFFRRSGNRPAPEEEMTLPDSSMPDSFSHMESQEDKVRSFRDAVPATGGERPEDTTDRIKPETNLRSTAASAPKSAAAGVETSGGLRSVFSRWRGKFTSRPSGEEKKAFLAKLQEEKKLQEAQNRIDSGFSPEHAALRADAVSPPEGDGWLDDGMPSISGDRADEATVSDADGWIDDIDLSTSENRADEAAVSDADGWIDDIDLSTSENRIDETAVSETDGWIDGVDLSTSENQADEAAVSDADGWIDDINLSTSENQADETAVSETDGWIDGVDLSTSENRADEAAVSDADGWIDDADLSESGNPEYEATASGSDGWIDGTEQTGHSTVQAIGIPSLDDEWDAAALSSGDVAGADGLTEGSGFFEETGTVAGDPVTASFGRPEGTSELPDPAFHVPDEEAVTEDGIRSEDPATLLYDSEGDSAFGETPGEAGEIPADADSLTEMDSETGVPLPGEDAETGAASGSGQTDPESYFRKPGTITAGAGAAAATGGTSSGAGSTAGADSAEISGSESKKKKEKSAKKAKKAAAAAGTAAAATAGGKAAAGKAAKKEKKKSRRRKKKKYKHPILARMLQFILLLFFLAVIAVFVVVGYIVITSPEIDPDNLYENIKQTSVLYDSNGNVLDSVATNEIRTNIDYDQMPEILTNAFVAIEDKTFYDHHGFNFVRIVGAIRESLSGGGQVSGTSTITQQLARNIYLSADRTMTRKIREAYYTLILERSLTKQQILEAYLNTINLGYGSYGVQAAAQSYFGIDVGDLTLAECAALASIPKSPSGNALLKKYPTEEINPEDPNIVVQDEEYTAVYNDAYQERQHAVLRNMLEQGMIDQASYDAAMGEDIREELNPATMINNDVSTYFSDYCIKEVISDLQSALNIDKEAASNYVYNKGLKIYTSLDVDLQAIAEAQFQKNSNFPGISGIRYDGQRNILNSKDRSKITLYNKDRYFNSEDRFVLSSEEYQIDESGNLVVLRDHRLNLLSVNGADGNKVPQIEFKPMYERISGSLYTRDGGYLKGLDSQYLSFDDDGNVVVSRTFLDSHPEYFVIGDDTVSVGPEYYELRQETIQPQGAMVVTDYHTGQIKVMIGGRGGLSGKLLYNRAANPRQPGSSIKPIGVYGPALQSGVEKGTRWTAGSTIEDSENRQGGRVWPHNWYSGYKGWVTLRTCVEQSINVTAVRLWNNIGVDYSLEYLKKNGITTIVEDGDATDLNPAALALGGMINGIPPVEMASAYGTFANGGKYIEPTTYSKVTDSHGNTILENQSETRQVYDEGVAFIMNDILRTTVTRGIASKAAIGTQPVAGKTGTTTDNVDAWFVGQTPQFSAAVWIGNDVNIQLTSGSGAAAALWAKTMRQLTAGYDRGSFAEKPDNVYVSGGEYYVNGTKKTGHAVTSTSNSTTKKSTTSSGNSSGSNNSSSSSSGTTKKNTSSSSGSGTTRSTGSSSSGSSASTNSSLSGQKVLYDQKTGMPYVKDSSGNRRDVLLDKKGKPYAYKN